MPRACNFPRVVFVWLRRACTLRVCRYSNSDTVCSSNRAPTRPESHILLTTAAIAMRTWQTVNSGFFPPEVLVDLCQEQVAYPRDDHVSLQTLIPSAFVVIQAEFTFFIFKAAFDAPTRKGNQQHRLYRGSDRSVAHKILDDARLHNVAGHDQMIRLLGQAFFVPRIDQHMLDLPHHRALLAILDAIALPCLFTQRPMKA